MTSGKVISENIKILRAKLGLTQNDLAKKVGIKYTTLMKVESGAVNRPSVQTMAKIAKMLGVNIEELIKLRIKMNRTILSQQINSEIIERLKNNPQDFSSFLQNQNDGTIIYVLEKLGRLENGYSKQPLLNLLIHSNENIRALSIKN